MMNGYGADLRLGLAGPMIPRRAGTRQEEREKTRACFKNAAARRLREPQGLKPSAFAAVIGTTKVVPCYKAFLKQAVESATASIRESGPLNRNALPKNPRHRPTQL